MNRDEQEEFDRLVHRLFDDRASDEELASLERLMVGDAGAQARERYLKYADVQVAMSELGADLSFAEQNPRDLPLSTFSEDPRDLTALASAGGRTRRRVAAILTIAAALLLTFYAGGYFQADQQVATRAAAPEETAKEIAGRGPGPDQRLLGYVAEISVISADAVWNEEAAGRDFLMRASVGEPLELTGGMVQLDYFSGAQIILRGPCRFVPTGESAGRLEHGELTGRVSVGDFILDTPTAKVVDLGTAFGATVHRDRSTEVHVLEGKVRVASVDQRGVVSDNALLLTRGMAARTIRDDEQTHDLPFNGDRFARSIELPDSVLETGSLSLVDVMNTDRAGVTRLASGIAPDTGGSFLQSALAELSASTSRRRHGVYHITNWHDAIDGVFIPSADGESVQIDSTGTEIHLPRNGAETSGPIWSRRRINDSARVAFHKDFWGGQTLERVLRRMQRSQTGMIGVHANVGVTFDLQAIRDGYGLQLESFETVVANLDNSDRFPAGPTTERRFTADFRIYLDGELRRSRIGFGRSDGDMGLRVPITATDRFLTLVSTDAGHYWFDQVVLIDPVLKLAD